MLERLKKNLYAFIYIEDVFQDWETLPRITITKNDLLNLFKKANWNFRFGEIAEMLEFLESKEPVVYLSDKVQECIQKYI